MPRPFAFLFSNARRFLFILLVVNLLASPAQACIKCVLAGCDYVLPPLFAWCLLAILWFLGNAFLFARCEFRPRWIWLPPRAVLSVIICLFVGAAMLGPLPLIPLTFIAVAGFVKSLSEQDKARRDFTTVRLFGYGMTAATVGLACFTLFIRQTRTDAEFIVRWSSSGPTHAAMDRLRMREPKSLADYQYIVAHGEGRMADEAAERIRAIEQRNGQSRF